MVHYTKGRTEIGGRPYMKSPNFCMPNLNNKGQPPKEMRRGARIFSGLSHFLFVWIVCAPCERFGGSSRWRGHTIFGGEPLYEDPQFLYVQIMEKGFPSKEMPRALRAAFFRRKPISLDGRLPNSGGLIYGPPKNGRTYVICPASGE